MFTNMFGNFLNVQEHFKKFQWNILNCSKTFLKVPMEHSDYKHFRMFTNSFGNFLNVQEHFEKFQWNILKCSPTNFLMNIFNNSQNFLRKNSEFVLKHFFTRHFDLKCLQTCSGTFWMFKNILKSSNGTFWNVPQQILKISSGTIY